MSGLAHLATAEGLVEDYLTLAQKAMQDGKFEKAIAYGVLALAWQRERDDARKNLA